MKLIRPIFLIILSLFVRTTSVSAGPFAVSGDGPAQAKLVWAHEELKPGSALVIGVEFSIKPGWHLYWRNPGGAGLAPNLAFDGPAGMQFGDVLWPVPLQFAQSGDVVGYGYEDKVILAVPASIASETDLTQQVEIKARWLACSESLCVPQRKTLSVDAKQLLDHKRWKAKFSGWRDSLERDQRSSRLITAVKQEGNLNSGVVQLYIDFAEPSSGVEWFPGPSEELETSNVKTSHNGHKVQVAFDVRVLDGQSSTKSYSEGLLIVKTGAGKRIGVRIQYDL